MRKAFQRVGQGGRSSPQEFWWFFLFWWMMQEVLMTLNYLLLPFAAGFYPGSTALQLAFWVALVPPLAFAAARRLRDADFSAWWLLAAAPTLLAKMALCSADVISLLGETSPLGTLLIRAQDHFFPFFTQRIWTCAASILLLALALPLLRPGRQAGLAEHH